MISLLGSAEADDIECCKNQEEVSNLLISTPVRHSGGGLPVNEKLATKMAASNVTF
jgi:hypothetical protein